MATYHGLVWVGGTRRGEEDVDVGGGCSREEGASSPELPLPPGRAPRVRDDIASDYYTPDTRLRNPRGLLPASIQHRGKHRRKHSGRGVEMKYLFLHWM